MGPLAISANRNVPTYEGWGVPVWSDSLEAFPGPLAGMLTGLERMQTEWLLTVPCDSPLFPADVVQRLAAAAMQNNSQVAFATAPQTEADGSIEMRSHPVFCLLHRDLRASLADYLASGSHRVMHWLTRQTHCTVAFDQVQDDPHAFANTNTPEDLQQLEQLHGARETSPRTAPGTTRP